MCAARFDMAGRTLGAEGRLGHESFEEARGDDRGIRPAEPRSVGGYAYGGRLPDRYRDWVLHDCSCPTWVLRHLSRTLTQLAPFLLVLLLPGPAWILASALVGGAFMGLLYSLSYMEETSERRLVKQGFPAGLGRTVREERGGEKTEARRALYEARYRSS
jgi:hypothetical protein